jgi:O-glycosyl hydrolase
MSHPGNICGMNVDIQTMYQQIDGFGVNINSKYFDNRLLPAMDLLVNDLGATLYRVDIWGKSNWIDPDGSLGKTAAFDPAHLEAVYSGEIFQRGWAMMRWLNQHNIRPYLTASGIVPPWMLGEDGKTLVDFDSFAMMMVSMLSWAKNHEKLDFTLFGPLNETDIGDPEGPTLDPAGCVALCRVLDAQLTQAGLADIRLVLAENAHFNPHYIQALVAEPALRDRVAVFALHDYSDIPAHEYAAITSLVQASPYAQTPLWMTEFGDLEQSGEREWFVAWVMFSRLLDQMQAGFRAALVWDAFDNYHDHDEHWTIYGIIRTGLRAYTPKKRFYALRHIYRFVRPGFRRVALECSDPNIRACAFISADRKQWVVAGMNSGSTPARVNLILKDLDPNAPSLVRHYNTSETINCAHLATIPDHGGNWPFNGVDALIPPASIFTLTNQHE